MKKLSIFATAVLVGVSMFTGCGKTTDSAPVTPTTEEVVERTTEADETTQATETTGTDYEGTYVESVAGKGTIKVTKDGDLYMISVEWANGAAEVDEWTFSGEINNDVLEYSNCLKVITTFDESGEGTPKEAYNTGTGKLSFADGYLTWVDDQEDVAKDCKFIKN